MRLRELYEFLFLCEEAGFRTLGEVYEFMKKYNMNDWQLFLFLDKLLFDKKERRR